MAEVPKTAGLQSDLSFHDLWMQAMYGVLLPL